MKLEKRDLYGLLNQSFAQHDIGAYTFPWAMGAKIIKPTEVVGEGIRQRLLIADQ